MKFFFLFLFSLSIHANALKTFEFDGCTKFFDGTPDKPDLWKNCCLIHDIKYWFGGTKEMQDKADFGLYQCVNQVTGEYWSSLIYYGVRLGHYSPIKFKYRFGWGWKEKRDSTFFDLSSLEIDYIKSEIQNLTYDPKILERSIKESF